MKSVRLIENFMSFQGEGPDIGKKMLFLRFKRCNRNCNFCDTQVKMRVQNEFETTFRNIQELVDEYDTNICITGGEPTYNLNLNQTIDLVNNIKCNLFNIETNGCQLVSLIEKVNKNKNIKYILSPKLFNQDDFIFYKFLTEEIKDNSKVYLKIVIEDRKEIYEYLDYLKEINFNTHRIFLMPEGKTRDELLSHSPLVFDLAEKYKCNFSSREHVIYEFV